MASSDFPGRHWSGSKWNHRHAGHSAIDAGVETWHLVACPSFKTINCTLLDHWMSYHPRTQWVDQRNLIHVVWEWRVSKWRRRGMRNTCAGCKTGFKWSWKMIQKNNSFLIRHVVLAGRGLRCRLLPIIICWKLRDIGMLLRGGLNYLNFSVWRRYTDEYLRATILLSTIRE